MLRGCLENIQHLHFLQSNEAEKQGTGISADKF
jgi:hypothetical protein